MNNNKKIINDPVFGFITIPNDFLYKLIQHPYVQRLNRIRQLGLASFVYPGAQHTRLLHSIGAMHLMNEAINNLRNKGHDITLDEANGALAAILLHDIGHGPFSHVLEYTLTNGICHEEFSLTLMQSLNKELNSELDICINIFKNEYPKKFLHQLVSGQVDVDRLDYLRRDSYFTGVIEGDIGSARIIKMLDLRNDRLVVEAKGIYSIENFLMSRRLMYWQVYFHKTAVAAEKVLIKTLKRAKFLTRQGINLFASPALKYFLINDINKILFDKDKNEVLQYFVKLDDNDIWSALKVWADSDDKILSILSSCIVNRKLFKIIISNEPFKQEYLQTYIALYMKKFGISEQEASYFLSVDTISSNMYNELDDSIDILYNDGSIKDISEASDMLNIQLLSKKIDKYYLCYLKLD